MGKVKFLPTDFPYTNPYVRLGDLLITGADVFVVTGRDRFSGFGLTVAGTENASVMWHIDGRGRHLEPMGLVTPVTLVREEQ